MRLQPTCRGTANFRDIILLVGSIAMSDSRISEYYKLPAPTMRTWGGQTLAFRAERKGWGKEVNFDVYPNTAWLAELTETLSVPYSETEALLLHCTGQGS